MIGQKTRRQAVEKLMVFCPAGTSDRSLVRQLPDQARIIQSLRDRSLASPVLHVEPKLHHVPILNDVVFSFDPKLSCFSRFPE
jgi:hypothetical protein